MIVVDLPSLQQWAKDEGLDASSPDALLAEPPAATRRTAPMNSGTSLIRSLSR